MTASQRFLEYWLPLFLWTGVIYIFSTDSFSSAESSRIILPILEFLFPGMSPSGIAFMHGVVRKAGHVTEYCVLGALAYRAIRLDEPVALKAQVLTGVLVLTTALTDEFHQLLTLSRTGSLMDVGYDCLGGILSLTVGAVYDRASFATGFESSTRNARS